MLGWAVLQPISHWLGSTELCLFLIYAQVPGSPSFLSTTLHPNPAVEPGTEGVERRDSKCFSGGQAETLMRSPLDSTIDIQFLSIMYIDELIARRLGPRELESILLGQIGC